MRPTNRQLCSAFRELLTKGFYTVDANGDEQTSLHLHEDALQATKPWRGKLWKAFAEIERRMCPQPGDFRNDK